MPSAPAIRVTSPSLALYGCGSTPGPISPATWTRSPPTRRTISVIMPIVVTTRIFLPERSTGRGAPAPPPPFSFGVSQPDNSRNTRKVNTPGRRGFPPCPDLPAVPSGGEENGFSGILSTPGREGKGELDAPAFREIADGQNSVVLVGDAGAGGETPSGSAAPRGRE